MDSRGKLIISGKYENKAILISIEDDGKGIPEDIRDKIFEKHNASISFESKINVGTTFFIKLPVN